MFDCLTDEWVLVLNHKEGAQSFSEEDDVYTSGRDPFVFANGLHTKVSLLNFLNFGCSVSRESFFQIELHR